MNAIVRKEIHLTPEIIGGLQTLADRKQWSLKKYMETVLATESKKAEKYKTDKQQRNEEDKAAV